MKVFAEKVVKHKKLIAILSLVLLIPCIFGYLNTRINYDMLTYLPDDIQTVQGQKILLDDFDKRQEKKSKIWNTWTQRCGMTALQT